MLKTVATGAGLLLLALAGLLNYDTSWFYADNWRVWFRLPGGTPQSLSVWWLVLSLPLVLSAIGLAVGGHRTLKLLGRQVANGRLALVVLFAAFSLFPWEYSWARPSRSHIIPYLTLGTCGIVLFLIGTWSQLQFLERPVRQTYRWLMGLKPGAFLLLAVGFMFTSANLVSWLVFEHMPHISDSIAQLFQARIFATGRLWLNSPCLPDFFDYGHIINNGHWYGQYQFLHSLVLVPGVLLGIPWIINPLLGAGAVLVLYFLGREVYDERIGRLAALLACLSPFVVNMSSEFMNHSTALLFMSLYLLFFFRTINSSQFESRACWPLLAGVCLGLAANVRLYSALVMAAPTIGYGLFLVVSRPRAYGRSFILAALAFSIAVSMSLIYNWLTNGNPLLFGYVVRWGPGHEIGFGHSGWGMKHTPLRGLVNTGHDFNLLNKFLFELPLPSLLPVWILLASSRMDRRDWLLLLSFLSLPVGYFFYWYHGIAFGPRFQYEAAACLLLLTVRGMEQTGTLVQGLLPGRFRPEKLPSLLVRAVPLLLMFMLGLGVPPLLKGYCGYWGVDGSLLRQVHRAQLSNALVFCTELGDAFNANHLGLTGEIVYARDYGVLNPILTQVFPGRRCYRGGKHGLAPLEDQVFLDSPVERALDSLVQQLRNVPVRAYRSVIWPFAPTDSPFPAPGPLPSLTDYRTVTNEVLTGRRELADYLPALACWVRGDPRDLLAQFQYLNRSAYFVMADYKLRRVWASADSSAAIYDIREAD